MTQYHEILAAAIRQIRPEDARRELHSTDEQIAARLSEFMHVQVSPQSDFVRLMRLALRIAARR